METALRLLEYPDFVEVPFMQDLHVRALYDGLKGHGSRANFMEEFAGWTGREKAGRSDDSGQGARICRAG